MTHKSRSANKPSMLWPVTLLLLIALAPAPAMAYLDPTTGSMLISAIVGLFASLVLAIRTYWYRIKSFFSRKPALGDADDNSD